MLLKYIVHLYIRDNTKMLYLFAGGDDTNISLFKRENKIRENKHKKSRRLNFVNIHFLFIIQFLKLIPYIYQIVLCSVLWSDTVRLLFLFPVQS